MRKGTGTSCRHSTQNGGVRRRYWQVHLAHESAVSFGRWVDINHADGVGLTDVFRIEEGNIGEPFWWRLNREFW
jgi:hypothetical protein